MKSLAQVIAEHTYIPGIYDCRCRAGDDTSDSMDLAEHAAHVAAAWREERTVRSVEQLAAAPRYCLIEYCGVPMRRNGNRIHRWTSLSTGLDHKDADVLPAFVLWLPQDGT